LAVRTVDEEATDGGEDDECEDDRLELLVK
jgi:hypothetical protein